MGHAFEQARVCALLSNNHKDCPSLAFTFVQDCGEPAGGLHGPNQARNFKVGWKPGNYAASFSIELTSKP